MLIVAILSHFRRNFWDSHQHLLSFLAVLAISAPAYRLGGKICEVLGDKEAAAQFLTSSYYLNTTQQDLIFSICRLVLDFPATVENYELQLGWLKKGEAINKQNNVR